MVQTQLVPTGTRAGSELDGCQCGNRGTLRPNLEVRKDWEDPAIVTVTPAS